MCTKSQQRATEQVEPLPPTAQKPDLEGKVQLLLLNLLSHRAKCCMFTLEVKGPHQQVDPMVAAILVPGILL